MGNSVNNEYGKGFTSQMWEMFLGGMKKTGAVFRPQIWEMFRRRI
jgi:hypothetical protein